MAHFTSPNLGSSSQISPLKKECVITDLDGTLANLDHRNPYDASSSHLDAPYSSIIRLLKLLSTQVDIVIVTGRKVTYSRPTLLWLSEHSIPYTFLYMREGPDHRKDTIVKLEFLQDIQTKYQSIWLVLDDRNQAVAMWREQGLTCLQVAEGNF